MLANEAGADGPFRKAGYGRGFRGAIAYCAEGKRSERNPDRCAWIEGRNLPTADPEIAAKIMRHTADQSKRVQRPVYHFSVDWAPDEAPTDAQAQAAVNCILEKVGLSEHQAMLFCHTPDLDTSDEPTNHYHVHVVVNRIHPELGIANEAWKSKERLEIATAEVAQEMGFELVPGKHNKLASEEDLEPRPTTGEKRRADREDEAPLDPWSKEEIRARRKELKEHFAEAGGWDDLQNRLATHGVELQAKGQGLIITDGQSFMKLSQMGKQQGEPIRMVGLEERFAESWESYETSDAAHKTRAERLAADEVADFAEPSLPRAVLELERTHAGVMAFQQQQGRARDVAFDMRDARRTLAKTEWMAEQTRRRLGEAHLQYGGTFKETYRNPVTAQRNLEKLIREHGMDVFDDLHRRHSNKKKAGLFSELARMFGFKKTADRKPNRRDIKERLFGSIGNAKGLRLGKARTKKRAHAHKAAMTLLPQRKGIQTLEMKLRQLEHDAAVAAARVAQAEHGFHAARQSVGSHRERDEHRRQLYAQRKKALRHVTPEEIWQSNLPEDQKRELAAEWEIHIQREQRRVAEKERFGPMSDARPQTRKSPPPKKEAPEPDDRYADLTEEERQELIEMEERLRREREEYREHER